MWWVCLTAIAAGAGATQATQLPHGLEVFHYEPLYHPLPTNLTIRPLSAKWHMNFTMMAGKSPPVVCVYMESIETFVRVQTFSGYCSTGNVTRLDYLKCSLETNTWNTLEVRLADDGVLLQEPEGSSVKLSSVDAKLPPDNLRTAVTDSSGVEAAVGYANSCPVLHYASTELDKEKVKEWQQERLHFYFRPAGPSSRLQYEVQCETQQGTVSERELPIQLGAEGTSTTAGWHLVELEQKENRATVRLNNTVLQDTELPWMCTSRRHVIWVVGGGSFSFKCTPPGAQPVTERTYSSTKTINITLLSVATGMGLTIVALIVAVTVFCMKVKNKATNNNIEDPTTNYFSLEKERIDAFYKQSPHRKKETTASLDSEPKPSPIAPSSPTLVVMMTHHEYEPLLPLSAPHPQSQEGITKLLGNECLIHKSVASLLAREGILPRVGSEPLMPSSVSKEHTVEQVPRPKSQPTTSSLKVNRQEGAMPHIVYIIRESPATSQKKLNTASKSNRSTSSSSMPHTGSDAPAEPAPLQPEPSASASAATATGNVDEDEEEDDDNDDEDKMEERRKGVKANEQPRHQER